MANLSTTFQSSDLSRNPLKVFSAAESAPVVLTRRDGDSLVLMNARTADARDKAFEIAAQLIAVMTKDEGSLVERMAEQFPWLLALDESDRQECVHAIVNAARASFSTHEPALVLYEILSWRETATAIAEGLALFDGEWFTESHPVPQPIRD